eukprot:gene5195-biopygen12595
MPESPGAPRSKGPRGRAQAASFSAHAAVPAEAPAPPLYGDGERGGRRGRCGEDDDVRDDDSERARQPHRDDARG